jgi:oligosaccharyltransferase complex subunit beta
MFKKFIFVFLLIVYVSSFSKKTLVILENNNIKNTHSQFFEQLKKRGYELEFSLSSNPKNKLLEFGEYIYDNLIIFAPNVKSNNFFY